MIRRVLILAPPSLVSQRQEEMLSKFDLDFVTTDQVDPATPVKNNLVELFNLIT